MGQRMLDALGTLGSFGSTELANLGWLPLGVVLAVSLASSLFLSYLYTVFFAHRDTGSELHRAFPLVGVAVTAIFVTVQFSLPLSLGLLGALSIVRFRTPVKEPEEIGFVLLVIATSLAAGTFNMVLLATILAVATAAMLLLQLDAVFERRRPAGGTCVVTLTTPESRAKLDDLRALLRALLPAGRIDALSDSAEATTLHYRFARLGEERLAELNRGVAAIGAGVESQVFFDRPVDS